MLAKKYRLNRKQINQIYQKGKGVRNDEIGIKFLENNQENSRYSVIIPKTVSKKATERNRIRRILFDELSRIKSVKNRDIIIRVFRLAEEVKIRENAKSILRRIDV